ncbi:MAG: DNA double-strand break repair nuclease NurA [Candidatus Nitrosocosmicus sp.]
MSVIPIYLNMLQELFLDAIRNKENKLSYIHGKGFERVLAIAKDRWIDYCPMGTTSKTVGVDSSWNKKSFQGIDFYVIDSIAIESNNDVSNSISQWDYGVGNMSGDSLGSRAMRMEIEVADISINRKPDIICLDGSLVSNLVHNKSNSYLESVKNLVNNMSKTCVIFISKNSSSKNQFGEFGSKAADIYYYNKLGFETGFSKPLYNNFVSKTLGIIEIYARLASFVPLIKIEIVGNLDYSIDEIKNLLNGLYCHSIKGYPYCLKAAHQACKISNNDVNRLANLYGFKNEFGSRDSLNE